MILSHKTKVNYTSKLLYLILIIYYYFILVEVASVCDAVSDRMESEECGLVTKEGEGINDDPIAQKEGKI